MKSGDDLVHRRIQANWSVYAWLMVVFATIALFGWLTGHYLH